MVGSLAVALYGAWIVLCAAWDFVASRPFLCTAVFCFIVLVCVVVHKIGACCSAESQRAEEKSKSYDKMLKELIGQLVVDLGAGPKQLSEYVSSDETIDSKAEAYKCFMREAEHGAFDGKLGAGICRAAGIGHEQNLDAARLLLDECAKLGDEDAKQLLALFNEDNISDVIECPNCGHGVHFSAHTCWFCDHPVPSVRLSAKQKKLVVNVLERLVDRMKSSEMDHEISAAEADEVDGK